MPNKISCPIVYIYKLLIIFLKIFQILTSTPEQNNIDTSVFLSKHA